jgi:hypothetical protein
MSEASSTPSTTGTHPSRNAPLSLMVELIEREGWDQAMELCLTHPEQMAELDPITGATVLHRLCTKPNAPIPLLEAVVEAFPEAMGIQETLYRATPLHLLSWTSQRSTAKFEVLLRYSKTPAAQQQHQHQHHASADGVVVLQLRNRFGGTVLHSVCGSQASLEVIRLIVHHHPRLVLARTHDSNETALTALWQSHLQSIPGHIQIATLLKHGTTTPRKRGLDVTDDHRGSARPPPLTSDHFDRFWEKVTFLARVAYQQSTVSLSSSSSSSSLLPSCEEDGSTPTPRDLDLLVGGTELHGLFLLRAPLHAIKVAILKHPEWAQVPDGDGNYPLHVVVLRRPFRVKDRDILELLLKAYPEAAGKTNHAGDTALVLALRERMEWNDGLEAIIRANPDQLATTVDSSTGLSPFLLAASVGGRVAVNTVYQLLCERPDVIARAVVS